MNGSKWILFAEDDSNDLELTMRSLVSPRQTIEVVQARDGMLVLDCLYRRGNFAGRRPGLPLFVLLDLKLPKLDGLEVLRQIKSDSGLKTIPVIMFSSSRDAMDVSRSYQLGANAYVLKPVNFREFVETIQQVRTFWISINEPYPQTPWKADPAERQQYPAWTAPTG
jgi:two-component system, response regulator